MTTGIEDYLKQLVEGQRKQAERDGVVLGEVAKIRKTVERLHERLDGIHETTVVHGEKIKGITRQQCKQDENCKGQHELIWQKMRERKQEAVAEATNKVKIWILTAVLSGVGAMAIVVFTTFIKK